MSISRSLIMLAALGFVSGPLAAQTPAPRPAARPQAPAVRGAIANTAAFLLARTGLLELSDEQVVQLAELARATDARREELRSELQAIRPETRPVPEADRAVLRERIQALRQAERAETQEARQAAVAVLSTEQRAIARELLDAARQRATAVRNRPATPATRRPRGRAFPQQMQAAPLQGR